MARSANVLFAALLAASAAMLALLTLALSGHLVGAATEHEAARTPARQPAPSPPAPAPTPIAAPEAVPAAAVERTVVDVKPKPLAPRPAATGATKRAPVVVSAETGACWMQARVGSEQGRLLYEGTLEQGRSIRFQAKRVWLRLGAARHVVVTVGGKRRETADGTVDLLL